VIDPDHTPHLRIDRFALLHGLTDAETAVCALMVQGLSTEQIAEMRNTAPVTAKNQIALIMQKAGISRRAELIRLVVRVLPQSLRCSNAHADVFHLKEFLDPVMRSLAAKAGLFDPPKRGHLGRDDAGVHAHNPVFQRLGHLINAA